MSEGHFLDWPNKRTIQKIALTLRAKVLSDGAVRKPVEITCDGDPYAVAG
jgi:hypothetical protein